jgi:hypothetical protein
VIDLYYFPYGDKTIKYKDIQSCKLLKLCDLSILKYKTWGMAFSHIWWPSDIRRYSRKYYIILDVNQWLKIGLTMDDKDITDVYKLIQQKINRNHSIENLDPNMINLISENEFEYQNLLKNN